MKIWNVNVLWSQTQSQDLGTFPTKEQAMDVAFNAMADQPWEPVYETENELHFSHGKSTLIVESIYVG